MKKLNKKGVLWSAAGALALSAVAGGAAIAAGSEETEASLPAPTVVRAINAAVAAKAGNVAGVEVETEAGKTKVDVEIFASDGKTYEVGVDAASGKVISVEADTEVEDEKDGANDKD